MTLQLQRLAQPSIGTPAVVLVDISAILRGVTERQASHVPWADLVAALARSGLRVLWVAAPTASQSQVGQGDIQQAKSDVLAVSPKSEVIDSVQPLVGLLTSRPASGARTPRMTVVTAGVEDHFYELRVLDRWAYQVIDVLSGKAWTPPRVEAEFGAPEWLPTLCAATGRGGGEPRVVSHASNVRYHQPVKDALGDTGAFLNAKVPTRVEQELQGRKTAIEAQAEILRGNRRVDRQALLKLSLWLYGSPWNAAAGTAYVVATTEEIDGRVRFVTADVLEGSNRQVYVGHRSVVARLKRLRSSRWFGPRVLDLLAASVAAGVPLPKRAADPALAAFVLDPDYPQPLELLLEPLVVVGEAGLRWLNDQKRQAPLPKQLPELVGLLPDLDRELHGRLSAAGVGRIFEEDISATLPVLARIERQGARVGTPRTIQSWLALRGELQKRGAKLAQGLAGVSNHDLARAPWEVVEADLVRIARLPRHYWHFNLSSEEFVERLAAVGVREAHDILQLRSIASESGLLYWLGLLGATPTPKRLRGRHVPQRTGRWGIAGHPLQNLPKRSVGARTLRSGLRPPTGYRLLHADWNAFEARLIAELSGDPTLVVAAASSDVHGVVAQQFGVTRSQAKAMLYGVIYGQTEAGFLHANPQLSPAAAKTLYRTARRAFHVAIGYLDQQVALWKQGQWLSTPAGFRRKPDGAGAARNFVVQGFGADCMRWVLRELDRKLEPLGGVIVHQAHDDVLVAAEPSNVAAVERTLRDVMGSGLVRRSGLFKNGTRMHATIKNRSTW